MQQQTDSFSKFGKSFQEKLCQLMLQDRPFCDQITEVLDIGFSRNKISTGFHNCDIGLQTKIWSTP